MHAKILFKSMAFEVFFFFFKKINVSHDNMVTKNLMK